MSHDDEAHGYSKFSATTSLFLGCCPAFAAPAARCGCLIPIMTGPLISMKPKRQPPSCSINSTVITTAPSADAKPKRPTPSGADFVAADPDKDGTLSKDEYLKVVENRFKAADPDNDGTLDEKELRLRAGQALLRLLQ